MFNGRMHTVIPGVIAVAGVLNGALLTAEQLGKFAEAWNGRPIPIYHPEVDGRNISANFPDVLERTAGTLFGARMDVDRLRADFWLDEARFDELGQSALLASLAAGNMVEVSTGYFADTLVAVGEYKGKPYKVKHENLRPDHVALLPNQIGACSIADGCGAPRVNADVSTDKSKLATAMSTLLVALGLKPNDCHCEVEPMKAATLHALAATLIANGAELTATNFDIAELEKMTDVGRAALYGALKALEKSQAKAAESEDEKEKAMKANAAAAKAAAEAAAAAGGEKPVTLGQLNTMVADAVKAAIGDSLKPEAIAAVARRAEIKARLLANQSCAFSAAELDGMALEALDKYERSIRPADYSGQGGGVIIPNSSGNGAPLMVNSGIFAAKPKAATEQRQ